MAERKSVPKRRDPFEQNPLSIFRRLGAHQLSGYALQHAATGHKGNGSGTDDRYDHAAGQIVPMDRRQDIGNLIHRAVAVDNDHRKEL